MFSVGECPKCKGNSLIYGSIEFEVEQVYYPFTCDVCFSEGKEWYTLEYVESTLDE